MFDAARDARHDLLDSLDFKVLRKAYGCTRKGRAVGVDGISAELYARDLDSNLARLLACLQGGSYKAPPVRWAKLPQRSGVARLVGVPTFEDRLAQRALLMLLEPLFEPSFAEWSCGYRVGRSPRQALERLCGALAARDGVVVRIDVADFFSTVGHQLVFDLLGERVRDERVLGLVAAWLGAGASSTGRGLPTGGVISPLLANVVLGHVFDRWVADLGDDDAVFPLRYVDDIAVLFQKTVSARAFVEAAAERLGEFGLGLNALKTRVVEMRRGAPGSFVFLGFRFAWVGSEGGWRLCQHTSRRRLKRAKVEINAWCSWNRQRPVPEQQEALATKLRGHVAYFGVEGNEPALHEYREAVVRAWRHSLHRRRPRVSARQFVRLMEEHPLPRLEDLLR